MGGPDSLAVNIEPCPCGHWEVQHRGAGEHRRCTQCRCGRGPGAVLVVELDGCGQPQSVRKVGAGAIVGQAGVWLNR